MSRGAVAFLLVAALGAPASACAGTAAKPKPKPAVKVSVLEYEYGFQLSRTTVPAGKVTFVMANAGALIHNFDLIPRSGQGSLGLKVGPFLVSGQRLSMTVTLKKGQYTYVCSVKYHAAQGMQGTLIVK